MSGDRIHVFAQTERNVEYEEMRRVVLRDDDDGVAVRLVLEAVNKSDGSSAKWHHDLTPADARELAVELFLQAGKIDDEDGRLSEMVAESVRSLEAMTQDRSKDKEEDLSAVPARNNSLRIVEDIYETDGRPSCWIAVLRKQMDRWFIVGMPDAELNLSIAANPTVRGSEVHISAVAEMKFSSVEAVREASERMEVAAEWGMHRREAKKGETGDGS